MGRIARSLALGEGFSNPFNELTGPTAWEAPVYPFLIAGVFKVFGVYTKASALVLLSFNSACAALTCVPIFLIAQRCFTRGVASCAAWFWALFPPLTTWATRWIWETSLATLLLAVIFWLALTMEDRKGWVPWIEFGLLWGIAALANPSLLSFLPACGLWVWRRRWKLGKRSIGGIATASLLFFAVIAPWLVRNYRTFGKFLFIRSNFGAELRLGNGPGADGTWMQFLHPTQNVFEMRRYRAMGEIGYVDERGKEAAAFIRDNPVRFVLLSARRFVYYWAGSPHPEETSALGPFRNSLFLASSVLGFWGLGRALHNQAPGSYLFLLLLLCYPAAYYFVYPHPRYRHPIEPEILILIVYVFSQTRLRREPAKAAARS